MAVARFGIDKGFFALPGNVCECFFVLLFHLPHHNSHLWDKCVHACCVYTKAMVPLCLIGTRVVCCKAFASYLVIHVLSSVIRLNWRYVCRFLTYVCARCFKIFVSSRVWVCLTQCDSRVFKFPCVPFAHWCTNLYEVHIDKRFKAVCVNSRIQI